MTRRQQAQKQRGYKTSRQSARDGRHLTGTHAGCRGCDRCRRPQHQEIQRKLKHLATTEIRSALMA